MQTTLNSTRTHNYLMDEVLSFQHACRCLLLIPTKGARNAHDDSEDIRAFGGGGGGKARRHRVLQRDGCLLQKPFYERPGALESTTGTSNMFTHTSDRSSIPVF